LLLATLVALLGLPSLLGHQVAAQSPAAPGAKPAGKSMTAQAAKAADDDAKDDEKDEDAEELTPEQVLQRLMARPEAVQGRTVRGQTIQDAPPFTATKRIDQLDYYPCDDCHGDQEPNPKPRVLKDEHVDLDFQHGGGRFWCYTCHNAKDMNHLKSLDGTPISFDESYKLCGECHFQRQKDWYFGGHGKRAGTFADPRKVPLVHSKIDFSDREKIGTWRGPRVLLNCTACHNAHSPSIKPYEPSPPPEVRKGLQRFGVVVPEPQPLWQKLNSERGAAQ